jgi:transposase InsO family protein
VSAINEIWSMDFVADALFDGRRLRTLTIVDNYTRECLAIEVDGSLRGEYVVAPLSRLALHHPLPRFIKADNGSEFISKAIDEWAYETRMAWRSTSRVPADRQCEERILQRTLPGGMSQRALVLVAGGCQTQNRGLARVL